MSSVNPTVTGSTSAGKTSLQFQTPAAPTSEAGSAFSVASSESGEDVFTFDEIDEEQEGTGYTVGDSEVYIQEKDKNTLAQDTLQMTLAEADAVDWDAWEWPLVRKADALARAAREAAEALLAQILAQGYTFTGDSYPASACYTNPHSSNGGTPVPYRLGLQPMRLLLNAAAPLTPSSTPTIFKATKPVSLDDAMASASQASTKSDVAYQSSLFLRLQ